MSKETRNINDEEKNVPRPEGYTIVKYAQGWMVIILFIGMIVSGIIGMTNAFKGVAEWLFLVFYVMMITIFWIIGRKITEVKVNLRITDEGVEQTRLSGSIIYPKQRLIKWENMKHYHLNGRMRSQHFLISVKNDVNFRITIPVFFSIFEKQKGNWESFAAFQNDFWGIAPEHDVHRAFFG